MKFTWSKNLYLRVFIKLFLYGSLSGIFVSFYLLDQLKDFLQQRTTITTKHEEASTIEFPTLTFCLDPGTKTSVGKQYGYEVFDEIFERDVKNITFTEKFTSLSYILNKDFEISASESFPRDGRIMTKILDGRTGVPFKGSKIYFDTQPIRTFFFGMCWKVQPISFEIKENYNPRLFWKVVLKIEKPMDIPRGIYLYLTSNETWNGISTQTWPKFNPAKAYLSFDNDFYKVQFKSQKHTTRNGVENTSNCLANFKRSCQFFTDKVSNETLCVKMEDVYDYFHGFRNTKDYIHCFELQKATTYKMDTFRPQNYLVPNNSWVIFNLNLLSMDQAVSEEVQIITSQSLIGSIGGSLGMFFGFSFLEIFNTLLNKVLNRK